MKLLSLLLFVAVSLSCSRTQKRPVEEPTVTAYKLIDDNRSAEAILILEEEKKLRPDDPKLLIALASAYAAYGGLDLPALIPTIESQFIKKNVKGLALNYKAAKKIAGSGETSAVTDAWVAMIRLVSAAVESFSHLPKISKISYVYQALDTINAIKDKTRGHYLYSATLRMVLFKNELVDHSLRSVVVGDKGQKCVVNLPELPNMAILIEQSTQAILSDLGGAYPKQVKNYRAISDQIAKAAHNVLTASLALSFAGDAVAALNLNVPLTEYLGIVSECE